MSKVEQAAVEQDIRRLAADGKHDQAVQLALEKYGPGLRKWVESLTGAAAADEVYAVFNEDLWKGFARFRWESSFQTWAYRLARNAAYRQLKARQREVLLGDSALMNVPHDAPSRTVPWLRSALQSGFSKLREQLNAEDQLLILLRVEREMSWLDIAQILNASEDDLDPALLKRRAGQLRQHFKRLRERLRAIAGEQGLLDDV